jgi:excisionase family DNA binding protein
MTDAPLPRSDADFPPVLTAALAAELLRVHVEYLRKMVRDGTLPCHRFPGGREMRFLRDELLDWVARLPADGGLPAAVSEARVAAS